MGRKKLMRNTQRAVYLIAVVVMFAGLISAGCARPARTEGEVAAINPAPSADLGLGAPPMGGPTESPTGGSAGGSGAAGYQAGRIAGPMPEPTTPAYSYSITNSRMSPVATDGSANASRGSAIAPDQPLVPSNMTGVTQQLSVNTRQVPVNVDIR